MKYIEEDITNIWNVGLAISSSQNNVKQNVKKMSIPECPSLQESEHCASYSTKEMGRQIRRERDDFSY